MADAKISLKVVLESAGIQATSKQVNRLTKELEKMAGATSKNAVAQNKMKRNMDGVAQRTGRANKDFARMSQGLGGLVQAYATVAANVFALSSAFLVLRRAADLSSMIKSAEDFSNRFGVSVTRVTEQLQAATGGALSFAEALPIVNKAVSAGVPIDKMEELAIAATKAAQTFGGTTTEALNRFISASQRGRVEIIQTLGIVIKTEKAYADYGATIGKTAQELSAFDRQQAILNATIEASQSVFDGVNIDPNPFQQLLTTLVDLKNEFSTLITDSITPLINSFNQSKNAALALISVIGGSVLKRIAPAAGEAIRAAQERSVRSTQAALEAAQKAERLKVKAVSESEKVVEKVTLDSIKKRDAAFKKSLKDRLTATSVFNKKVIDDNNKVNVAILTSQRALLAKEIKLRESGVQKGRQKLFAGTSLADLKAQQRALNQIGATVSNVNIKLEKTVAATRAVTTETKKLSAAWTAFSTNVSASVARTSSLFRTGYAQTFDSANTSVLKAVGRTNRAILKLGKDIITLNLAEAMTSFGRAAGRSLGLISRGLFGALNLLSTIGIVLGIGGFLWEKYGDKITGVTKEQRQVIDASKEFTEGLEKANSVLAEGIDLWGDRAPSSLKDFVDSFTFAAGVFETIANEITQFDKKVVESFGGRTFDQITDRIKELRATIEEERFDPQVVATPAGLAFVPPALSRISTEGREAKEELDQLLKIVEELGVSTPIEPLINQFENASKFANSLGISLNSILTKNAESFSDLNDEIGFVNVKLLELAARTNSMEFLRVTVERLNEAFKESPETIAALNNVLTKFFSSASGDVTALSRQTATALKQLQETAGNFDTFSRGLDKLRSQKSPFKEVFGFALDAENALKDLVGAQKELGATSLEEAFKAGELKVDLESIRALLGSNVETIQEALTEATKLREEFQKQLELQLLGALKLKVVQQQISNIKKREIGTDEARLEQVSDLNKAELERVRIRGDIADSNARAARRNLDALREQGEVSQEILRAKQAEIDLFERQLKGYNEEERRLLKFRAIRLERLAIDRDILSNLQQRFNIIQQTIAIEQGLVEGLDETVNLQQERVFAQAQELRIQKKLIENTKARIRVETEEGALRDRLLALEDARLQQLEAQLRVLERQKEITDARALERAGVTVFSEQGVRLTAQFFVRELEKELPKLKSVFEVLGQGFSNTVLDTFDKAVDNLLEGARDFGDVMIEFIKGSLRETFGDAIKNALRENILTTLPNLRELFKIGGEQPLEEISVKDAERSTDFSEQAQGLALQKTSMFQDIMLENASSQLIAQERTAAASELLVKQSAQCCGVQAPQVQLSQSNDSLTKRDVEGALSNTSLQVQTVESNPGVDAAVNAMGTLIRDGASSDTQVVVTVLQSLIGALFAQQASDTTSDIISAGVSAYTGGFTGFGMGGMMSGRSTNITPLADGGIVTRPSMALIGEGKNNEAVVPLPNNREIPVEMRGGGDTINIEQSFDFRNADPAAATQLRVEARAIEERTFNRVFDEINKGGRYAKIVGRRK